MYKLYKCMLVALLTLALLLVAGCKQEQSVEVNNQNIIQLPDGMEVEIGVGTRDEEDLNGSGANTEQGNTGNENTGNTGEENPDSTGEENTGEETPDTNQPDNNKPDSGKQEDTQLPIPGELDYLGFYALTEDQQDAYIESFESLAAFNKWFNEARAEYESQLPEDEIINGEIDLDKYNPKN